MEGIVVLLKVQHVKAMVFTHYNIVVAVFLFCINSGSIKR